jgi:pentose-5-phosphate-3-epimerase
LICNGFAQFEKIRHYKKTHQALLDIEMLGVDGRIEALKAMEAKHAGPRFLLKGAKILRAGG